MTNDTLQWQLSDLYNTTDDPQIEADFKKADSLIGKIEALRGKISDLSSAELFALLEQWEDCSITLQKIGLYAGLLESTNVGVDTVTHFSKKIEEQLVERSTRVLFLEVELSHLSEAQWQTHLKSSELKPYTHFLQNLYLQAKHTLSESEERILTEKSQTSQQALLHLYSVTTDTLSVKKLTLEELLTQFHDANPRTRKEAAMALYKLLATNDKTTPAILNSLLQDKAISDRLRHYEYPEEARYLGDEVEKETVEALISAVGQSDELVTRYYEIKKKLLDTDTLYWWDRYAPLPTTKTELSREEGLRLVIEAFEECSPELAQIVQDMVGRKHIDWLPHTTKRGGAFCAAGEHKGLPFVLLNYTNTPRDAMTLAHELGHAIHDVYAQQNNVFFETHPSLALAEVASTFGESLLFDKLMKSPTVTREDKITLLMSFIEDRFATVFRQISMFQVEQQLHIKRREEGELSKEQIDEIWDSTMKKPFEKALTYTKEHRNTWMYVSHIFNWPFYVFSYAYAQLCSLALYKRYKEQGSNFVPGYIELLKAGGSAAPKEILHQAGIDVSSTEFWKDGLGIIEEYITLLEETIDPSSDTQT